MRQRWSKEKVMRCILERHQKNAPLNDKHVHDHCIPLYGAARQHFGSWRQAIEASGLSYASVRIQKTEPNSWNKQRVIEIIRAMHKNGMALNSNHIQKAQQPLFCAACRYFGEWRFAIEASGLDYAILRKGKPKRKWTRKMVIEEIQRRRSEGESIRGGNISLDNQGLYKAAKRCFGKEGWARARVAAGYEPVDPPPNRKWDKNTVCLEIQRIHSTGITLDMTSLRHGEHGDVLAGGQAVYGSWAQAVRAAGFNYSLVRKHQTRGWWTKARVISLIRRLEKQGTKLASTIIKNTHGGLWIAGRALFGSWPKALRAASVEYKEHYSRWSTQAWLDSIEPSKYAEIVDSKLTRAARK